MSLAALIAHHMGQPVTPVTPTENPEVTPAALGREGRNPCNPCNPEKHRGAQEKPEPHNPDALLLELARTLPASPKLLRALLSDDDMQDIAEGATSRGHLLAYFRLMRSDGKPLADDEPLPTRTPESRPSHIERMKAWKPAHERLINHLMACQDCFGPLGRYCDIGAQIRHAYIETYDNASQPKEKHD